ncbi:MAG: hypothetical protein BRD52_07205, partial [Bacteroidetes bacterium SW_4_67_19]
FQDTRTFDDTITFSNPQTSRTSDLDYPSDAGTAPNYSVFVKRDPSDSGVTPNISDNNGSDTIDVRVDLSVSPTTTDYTHDTLRVAEPPLVAVWIASPPESTQDVVNKIHGLLGAGVRSCWLVQPATRSITVYGPDMQPRTFSEGTVRDDTLEKVEVSLNEVFGEA